MFNIGPGELIVILILALVLLGPDKLPEMARTVGKGMRELRRATEDLKDQVETEFYKLDEQKPVVKPPEGPRFAKATQAGPAQLPAADASSSAPTIPPSVPSAEPSPQDSPGSSGLRAGADSPKDPAKTA